jgi:hypothetical protein
MSGKFEMTKRNQKQKKYNFGITKSSRNMEFKSRGGRRPYTLKRLAAFSGMPLDCPLCAQGALPGTLDPPYRPAKELLGTIGP